MPLTGYGDGFHRRVDVDAWMAMWSITDSRQYEPGDTLTGPAGHVQVISSGLVRVTARMAPAREAFLRVCGEGQVLAEHVLLPATRRAGRRHGIAAVALTPCSVLLVSRGDFLGHLALRPDMARIFAEDLIERTIADEETIIRLSCDSVEMRLAWLLADLARHGGTAEKGGGTGLPVDLSEKQLALWTGSSRRSVDYALEKWRERGIVVRRAGKLVIVDLAFLDKTARRPAARPPAVSRTPDPKAETAAA